MKSLDLIGNSNCKLCELHENANTVCLMGRGSANARIMLIGEAPGREEDAKGKVFVGDAGKMLKSILEVFNLDEEQDVYITNPVKCHPPSNIKPRVSHIESCAFKYLVEEIKAIHPRLIICMGDTAAKTMMQSNPIKIAELRRNIFYTQHPYISDIPFIVTYHPAAVFYNPELLEFISKDFEYALQILHNKIKPDRKRNSYIKVSSLDEIEELQSAKIINLDLETDGLNPFIKGKEILSFQISTAEGIGYYLDWTEENKYQLKKFLSRFNGTLNGHNIKFDLKWLWVKAGIKWTGKVNDTLQNIHLLNENFPNKSLDVVATTFTKLKGHKKEFSNKIRDYVKMHKDKKEPIRQAMARLWKQAFFSIPESVRIKYGCGDSDSVGRLRNIFIPKIREEGMYELHKLLMESVKMFVDIESNGMKIDLSKVQQYKDDYEYRIDTIWEQLNILAPKVENHNSNLQLRQLLYGNWRLTPHEVRVGKKRVRYSTSKDALELILQDRITNDQRTYIQKVLEYRKYTKLYGTYIVGLPKYVDDYGYIHADWNLSGTDTGRSSCSNPNLQQIPRKGDIKEIFISRFGRKGKLLQIDVSQGELRIAAHESNEPTMIRLFREGTNDIHTSMGALINKKPENKVTEDERYNTKQVNFLVLYGGGAQTAAQEMKSLTISKALEFIDMWHKTFPGWKKHAEEVRKFVLDNGYVVNSFGRRRRLHILNPNTKEGMTILRKALNSPIQGGLADYNKLCGVALWKRIDNADMESKLIGEVHDAWMLDVPDNEIDKVAEMAIEEFENPNTERFGFKFKVPMKIDIKVGSNWKDMEDYAR